MCANALERTTRRLYSIINHPALPIRSPCLAIVLGPLAMPHGQTLPFVAVSGMQCSAIFQRVVKVGLAETPLILWQLPTAIISAAMMAPLARRAGLLRGGLLRVTKARVSDSGGAGVALRSSRVARPSEGVAPSQSRSSVSSSDGALSIVKSRLSKVSWGKLDWAGWGAGGLDDHIWPTRGKELGLTRLYSTFRQAFCAHDSS